MPKDVTTRFGADTAPLKAGVREAQLQLAKYDASIRASGDAQAKIAASNERWQRSLITGAKVAAVGVGGIAAALAGAAIAAAQFDSAMRNVNTIAQAGPAKFKALEQSVLSMASVVGKSPTDLAKGLYDLYSSGLKGANALAVLKQSAIAATAGLTDTQTAAQVIVSALHSFQIPAKDANKVASDLFETVNTGIVNFPQLATAFGQITGLAPDLGASLQEATGAFAALTLKSGDSARAATQTQSIFSSLLKPSKDLSATIKDLGFANAQAGVQSEGLPKFLEALREKADDNHTSISKLFPDVRALGGFLGLTAKNAQAAADAVAANNQAYKDGNEQTKAFNEQSKSTAVQFDKLKASVDVAAITIGQALLPELNKGIDALNKWLTSAQKSGEISAFAKTVASDVEATVKWLEGLGPAAETGISTVEATFRAAVPYVEGLERGLKDIAPELEAIGGAGKTVVSALGPGTLLPAAAGFLAVRRAALQGQSAVGGFAKIMKAGSEATALAGGGFVSASGKIDKVGKAAIAAESQSKIFARGLASTFGPTLLAVGAAGIIGSIVLIEGHLRGLEGTAHDTADAFIALENARLGKQGAKLDVDVASRDLTKSLSASASAHGAAATAQQNLAAARATGDPKDVAKAEDVYTAAVGRARDATLAAAQARQRLTLDNVELGKADAQVTESNQKLASKFQDLAAGAQLAGAKVEEYGKAGGKTQFAALQKQLDTLSESFQKDVASSDDSTAADKRKAAQVGDLIRHLTALPDKKAVQIITNDIASGKIDKIRGDLEKLGLLKPKPTIDANANPLIAAVNRSNVLLGELVNGKHTVHIKADTTAVSAALAGVNRSILHLTGTPFTVKINEAAGTTGHFNAKGQWVYGSAGGSFISGPAGADDVPVLVTGQEAILNERQQAMVDSGGYTVRGALAATGAQTIHRGGGYSGGAKPTKPKNMKFEAFPLSVYQSREANAEAAVKTDRGKLKTYTSELSKLQNAINKAHEKVGTAKTAKTRAEYETQATALERKSQTRIDTLSPLIANEQTLLPQDVAKYQEATRIAKLAAQFAARIKRDQDNASEANSQMQLASDRWSQASTPAGKASALAAYSAAQKRRTSANQNLVALLSQAKSTIGDTGSQYFRDTQAAITAAQIDQTQNQDATGAPGYVAPGTSFDASSLVFLSAEHQYQLDKALQLDANGNPVDPGTAKYLLGLELANAQRGEAIATASGNFATASQIVQTENDIQGQLAQLSQTAAAPTADVSAQLAQSQGQVLALTRGAGYGAAAASAFSQPGLGMMTILGDPRSVQQLAGYATRGFNAMPFVVQNSGAINV